MNGAGVKQNIENVTLCQAGRVQRIRRHCYEGQISAGWRIVALVGEKVRAAVLLC